MALGALAAGAMPPLFLVFLLVPAFTGLAWLVDASRHWRSAAAVGWWFGLGHFVAGIYWIASSFLVDAATFGWMIPFAITGLSALLAGFFAVATGLSRLLPGHGAGRALLLAACWAGLEWVRSWAFTGFPWNLVATTWVFSDAMIQGAALLGPYGLGLLTVWAAASPAYAGDGRRGGVLAVLAFLLLAVAWGGGAVRLALAGPPASDGALLRLVQPNIQQHMKWRDDLRLAHVVRQIDMSHAPPGPEGLPAAVIWSETAVPFFLAADEGLLREVAAAVPPHGLLIAGAPRGARRSDGGLTVWNSLHAINPEGRVLATADKFHLVPFGEYVPLPGILGLTKLTAGRTDFTPGDGPRTLHLPDLPPFSPLICYEIIFPAHVVDAADRPDWILNLTNDGWFGLTSGPHQHLAAARLRAVEEGLPVVRAANTGISAVIDSHGRLLAYLGLGRQGVIDAHLPPPLTATPYARFGNAVTLLLVMIALAAGAALARRPS